VEQNSRSHMVSGASSRFLVTRDLSFDCVVAAERAKRLAEKDVRSGANLFDDRLLAAVGTPTLLRIKAPSVFRD
jgi:hypothetical protein